MSSASGSTTYALEREDHNRDAAFNKVLHGSSANSRGGVMAMMKKDAASQKAAIDGYFKHWDNKSAAAETDDIRKARRDEYASLTRQYYNLATDFYEYGWGTSFHFCRFAAGESFSRAIARHEHYLALKLGLQEKQRVLDVGCGVGGPAREMIKFANVHVTGLNNNDYQLERATNYARKEKLGARFTAAKGDFMQMSFPENTFDAVYSIEATVHAPDLQGVYEQIFRVLKPGGKFAVLEWLMTDRYDNQNPDHRACRLGIEQGDGISNMVTVSEGLAAFQAAGFELLENIDLADRRSMSSSSSSNDHNDDAEDNEDNEDEDFNPDRAPWYWPLAGDFRYLGSLGDIFAIARMTWWGRNLIHRFMGLGEKLGLMPQGTQRTGDSMALAADCLVKGGKEKLFTPMYLMVGRKPSNP